MLAGFPADSVGLARRLAGNAASIVAVPDAGGPAPLQSALAEVDFLVVDLGRADLLGSLRELPSVKVVQVLLSGTDWIESAVPRSVTLCSARGSRDTGVAEWVVAAVTGAASGLLAAVRQQGERGWERSPSGEVSGQRVMVIGMGSIGTRVYSLLQALDAEVVGVARHARPGIEPVARVPELLPGVDTAVLLTPLTEQTRGMADRAFLSRLRDGALLVNAGRGAVVDTEALTREVATGRVRCVLDVVDPEPLPADHALWGLPGCYLSPHIAGATGPGRQRAVRFAASQLLRYAAGEPLLNVIPGFGH